MFRRAEVREQDALLRNARAINDKVRLLATPEQAEELADRLYAMLPNVRITGLLADATNLGLTQMGDACAVASWLGRRAGICARKRTATPWRRLSTPTR
jgi:hypothetical protein